MIYIYMVRVEGCRYHPPSRGEKNGMGTGAYRGCVGMYKRKEEDCNNPNPEKRDPERVV